MQTIEQLRGRRPVQLAHNAASKRQAHCALLVRGRRCANLRERAAGRFLSGPLASDAQAVVSSGARTRTHQ